MVRASASGGTVLGPGGEFDLIRRLLADAPISGPHVRLGPGDDGAVVGDGWVLSTDLSVEDVHFRREWITDEEIGFRAASSSLSDLAAMAAEPVGVLVSMAYAPDGPVDALAVQRGVQQAAAAVGAAVLGGDMSRSPGPLFLDVTVVGRCGTPAVRSGSLPGDEVWVTGSLGASAAAVALWRRGEAPSPGLRRAFAHPEPRVGAALALAGAGVIRSLIDVSDGLAGDAGHLAAAGGVALVLERSRLPVAAEVTEVLGHDDALQLALRGGEDYELCLVAAPGAVDGDTLSQVMRLPLTRIGWVEEGSGVWLQHADGSREALDGGGFNHLGDGA